MEDGLIMDITSLAGYLGVSQMTIYRYAKAALIPAFKIGTQWRFHKKSIDRWIEEKERYHAASKITVK